MSFLLQSGSVLQSYFFFFFLSHGNEYSQLFGRMPLNFGFDSCFLMIKLKLLISGRSGVSVSAGPVRTHMTSICTISDGH